MGKDQAPDPVSLSPTPNLSPEGEGRIRRALAAATNFLADISETPRLDAELLMAHALGIAREQLLLNRLDSATPHSFGPLLARRLAHEPIAYITGTRAFWTIELAVGPGVLVPRADSETLLDAALAHFGKGAPRRILDLGTGPGTLLLAALDQWAGATGLGVDASPEALAYAKRNAATLGLADRVEFQTGDWAAGIDASFDLILANPPYIGTDEPLPAEVRVHEPGMALFAGADGLDDYRRIVPQLPALLAPGGAAILEIGSTQAPAVTALLVVEGFAVALHHDLGGNPRALVATHSATIAVTGRETNA
ncbi:release factor glutamine methyltransferase [Sphingomonas sp. UYP23]